MGGFSQWHPASGDLHGAQDAMTHDVWRFLERVWLLAGHVCPQLGLGVVDEVAADIHGHLVDRAGELERVAGVGDLVWT